jgi:hypothetical protein
MSATALKHGTKYRYDQGCHCDKCREAKMAARRTSRDRARALNSPAYQRELAASRALKERYRGQCERCGNPTSGCHGPGLAPTLCLSCSATKVAEARRGQGATVSRVLELLDGRELRMIKIAAELGITTGHAGNALHRLLRYGLVERVSRGVYRRAA